MLLVILKDKRNEETIIARLRDMNDHGYLSILPRHMISLRDNNQLFQRVHVNEQTYGLEYPEMPRSTIFAHYTKTHLPPFAVNNMPNISIPCETVQDAFIYMNMIIQHCVQHTSLELASFVYMPDISDAAQTQVLYASCLVYMNRVIESRCMLHESVTQVQPGQSLYNEGNRHYQHK